MSTIKNKLDRKTTNLTIPFDHDSPTPKRASFNNGDFFNIELTQIKINPGQPRKYFNEAALSELAKSIKTHGVLEPILVHKKGQDEIVLVAGERRYRASKLANIKKIPAIFTTGNPSEISIIENLQREELKPIEESEALGKMIKEHEYTQAKLATIIGKGRSTVAEILSLNKLPDEIKENCRHADNFSRRILVEIAKQKSSKTMLALYAKVKNKKLNGSTIRNVSRDKNSIQNDHYLKIQNNIKGLSKKLTTLNLGTLTATEKKHLSNLLNSLKSHIDNFVIC